MGAGKIAALAALAALASACAGPRPSVDHVTVEPSPLAGRVRVEALVRNRSRGEGEIELQLELRDKSSGPPIESERTLELAGHEVTLVVTDVEAPPGDYRADVQARYPPE